MSAALKPGYKQTEVGVIPEDWESSSVRGIASAARNAIVGGPFGSDLVSSDYVKEGVPVIRGTNMGGQWVSGPFVFVTPIKAKLLESNLARPGDIVFTQRGTLGQVSLVPVHPFDAYLVSQSQMKLSVQRDAADPLFFYYIFTSDDQQDLIRGGTIQTGVPHINLGILRDIPVPVPPLAEQQAIATALSEVDGLLGALERLIAKKRDLKQAAMQQLLTGQTRLPGFSGDWVTKRLGDVAELKNGYAFKSDTYTDIGILKIVTIANVQDGFMIAGTCNTIAKEPTDLQAHQRLKLGDILISMTGNVGRVCRVNEGHCLLNQRVGKLVPTRIEAGLLFVLINQSSFIAAMTAVAKGGAQPNLSAPDITNHQLRLPIDTAEQTAIAAVLSEQDGELAVLEQRREKTRALKQAMMQELLTGRTRLI